MSAQMCETRPRRNTETLEQGIGSEGRTKGCHYAGWKLIAGVCEQDCDLARLLITLARGSTSAATEGVSRH